MRQNHIHGSKDTDNLRTIKSMTFPWKRQPSKVETNIFSLLRMLTHLDFFLCAFSVALVALCQPLRSFNKLWPFVTLVLLFGGFVFWNGGVALGISIPYSTLIHQLIR